MGHELMATYIAREIVSIMTIKASSDSEADAKYDAWFSGDACPSCAPLDVYECGCVEHQEECDHILERITD